jgi:hypothetical protein
LAIDYQQPPIPKLVPEDLTWLNITIDPIVKTADVSG